MGVPSNEVLKLPKDVATNIHHVLMTVWGPKYLKDGLGSIALGIIAAGDNLQHAVPHLLSHTVTCNGDKVEDSVHILAIVCCVFLSPMATFRMISSQMV